MRAHAIEIVDEEDLKSIEVAKPHLTYKQKLAIIVRSGMKHLAPVECPLKHYFAPGVYIREIFMPAGAYIIGKIHKTEHFNIVQTGRLSLINEDGTRTEIVAPYTFVSKAGVQKALIIHEDTTWSCIHLTEERSLEALEAQLIEHDDSYPVVDRTEERLAIERSASQEQKLLERA